MQTSHPVTALNATSAAASAAPGDSARLEAFSDGVFAFAATLLVVALEVPSTMLELERVLLGFVPFTLSFGALVFLWSVHRSFFRRFPVGDRMTVALNSCLLFVVLFYVYPLKFLARGLATMFFGSGVGGGGGVGTIAELGKLFTWYGAGFAAIFLFVALLYVHVARSAGALGLADLQRRQAIFWARHYAILCSVGLLSLLMAVAGVGVKVGMPGWIYALIGPLCGLHGYWSARNARNARRLARLAAG